MKLDPMVLTLFDRKNKYEFSIPCYSLVLYSEDNIKYFWYVSSVENGDSAFEESNYDFVRICAR